MSFLLETPRLRLREMTVADVHNAFELNSDPEVLRFTGDSPFQTIEEAADFLAKYDHYRKYGFGRWAVERTIDGAWIGWCGLKYTDTIQEFDLGFRLLRKFWGFGYATEAGQACLQVGFTQFEMPEIVGRAMKANLASIKVLEKVGMAYVGPYDFEGDLGVLYKLTSKQWNARK